jgi:hypothetical protein
MELLPPSEQHQPQCLDLSEGGAQRVFQLTDEFYIFDNPHGLEEIDEEDQSRLKELYGGRRHKEFHSYFAPRGSADLYYAIVESLQYIFVRNFITGTVISRVSLMAFPVCLALDMSHEDSAAGESVIAWVGTKEGTLKKVQIDSAGSKVIGQTREGMFYGSITAIDQFRDVVAIGNQSGETALFFESE